jgi:hypothetical protein
MPRAARGYNLCQCGNQKSLEAGRCHVCSANPWSMFLDSLSDEQRTVVWTETVPYSQEKLQFTCPKHGVGYKYHRGLLVNPKTPCKGCQADKRREQNKIMCVTKFGDLFQYPDGFPDKVHDSITYICQKHGRCTRELRTFLKKGCSACSYEKLGVDKALGVSKFAQRAREIHGDKYKYDKVEYTNTMTSVVITCPIHGDFRQLAGNHLSGKGCRRCSKERTVSDLELEVKSFVTELGVDFAANHRVANYEVDLLIPDKGIGFEVNGSYWHCTKFKKKYDHQIKSKAVIRKGIGLGHIWEHDWLNRQGMVKDRIKDAVGLLEDLPIDHVVEWDSGSFACFHDGKLIGGYSKLGEIASDFVVSLGVSRLGFIKSLAKSCGASTLRLNLDYGELLPSLYDMGLTVKKMLDPVQFYIQQYPLMRLPEKTKKSFSAYDSGQILLTWD